VPLALGVSCLARAAGERHNVSRTAEGIDVQGVIIRDGTEPGGSGNLDFDLVEVLAALGQRVMTSSWRCPRLQYTSRDERDVPVLEQVGTEGRTVLGAELTRGIGQLLQVIDGEFEAFDENEGRWAVIRAVDSSWWEVWSDDKSVLEAVRTTFRITEDAPQIAG
jgi:hypothetical protein